MKIPTTIKKLIVMPLGLRLDWTADYEMETARELAKTNTVIVFAYGEGQSIRQYVFNPIRAFIQKSDSLYIYRPIFLLPLQRLPLVAHINARIASWHLRLWIHTQEALRRLPKVYWSFSLQSVIQPKFFGPSYFAIYDCVDVFTSARQHTAKIHKRIEQNIMRQSHVVFTNSSSLYALHKHHHAMVIQTGEGLFALDAFSAYPRRPIPRDIKTIPRPRVLFAGNINARLDFSLICRLARITPSVSYVFVGRKDPAFEGVTTVRLHHELERLNTLPNIYMLGEKPKRSMPAYMNASDIGFVPYDTRHIFNTYSSPMKIQEYFYAGIPVLGTPIPEMRRMHPYVQTFRTPKEGAKLIQTLYKRPWPASYKQAQKIIAESNSIEQKIKLVTRILHTHYPNYF